MPALLFNFFMAEEKNIDSSNSLGDSKKFVFYFSIDPAPQPVSF